MINLEEELFYPLYGKRKKTKLLTCSSCAKLKYNAVNGFCDREFQVLREERRCLECLCTANRFAFKEQIKPFQVQGIDTAYCLLCRNTTPLSEMAADDMRVIYRHDKYRVCRRDACIKGAREIRAGSVDYIQWVFRGKA